MRGWSCRHSRQGCVTGWQRAPLFSRYGEHSFAGVNVLEENGFSFKNPNTTFLRQRNLQIFWSSFSH